MNAFRVFCLLAGAALFGAPSAMGQNAQPPVANAIALGRSIAGDLSSNDTQRPSGKYEDVYLLQGRRGDRVQLNLSSAAFDTYLVMTGPDGFFMSNDDAEGSGGATDSRLVVQLPADGAYRISATTFRPGETGAYQLQASAPAANAAVSAPVAAQPIAIGAAVTGNLSPSDGRAADGSFTDTYRFTARRGQRVTVSMSSSDFDTYLMLGRPDGTQDANDDTRANGQTQTDSRIDTVLAEDGQYVITASSYRPGTSGKYRLTLAPSAGDPRQVRVPGGPRVVALLVGVSDYGGRTSNLPNTDEDARQLYTSLRDAGLLHPASRLLTNADATTKNVASAFAQASAAAGPNDVFLFFYSGHGNQVDTARTVGELDGRAETIELYDAAMTDAELQPLFDRVHPRLAVVALDSCFSGGFRNLIDRPNVMGLFSSEEDLTSLVASQFKAGGYLSYFLRAGLSGEADFDGDRIVTTGELSTYVRRRFRREGDIPATTREDDRNFQNILVERGGLTVDDVVVRLASADSRVAAPLRRTPATMRPMPVSDAKGVGRVR